MGGRRYFLRISRADLLAVLGVATTVDDKNLTDHQRRVLARLATLAFTIPAPTDQVKP